jgi:hypothetical protein
LVAYGRNRHSGFLAIYPAILKPNFNQRDRMADDVELWSTIESAGTAVRAAFSAAVVRDFVSTARLLNDAVVWIDKAKAMLGYGLGEHGARDVMRETLGPEPEREP